MKTRTTVTIDVELFDLVRQEAAQTRRRFGEVLNDRLRLGFSPKSARKGQKFKVEPFPADGFAPGVDEKKLNQLLDSLEVEAEAR